MEPKLLFDLETDGVWEDLTKVHCGWVVDLDTSKRTGYRSDRPGEIEAMVARLQEAALLVGHNIGAFDIPVLEKLHNFSYRGDIVDTLCCSWLCFFDTIKKKDFRRVEKGLHPANLVGRHSLEAWGHRLRSNKIDFQGPWDTLTDEMYEYGEGDVILNEKLYHRLLKEGHGLESFIVESNAFRILGRQEHNGVCFDKEAAEKLLDELAPEKTELERQLQEAFPAWWAPNGKDSGFFAPKRKNGPKGWGAGDPMTKVKMVEFNPGSDDHVARYLTKKYGWKPNDFTKKGNISMTEQVLEGIPYLEAKLLLRWRLLTKRVQQIESGQHSWFAHFNEEDGRIHGRVKSTGTVTTRMSHNSPNLGQVPKVGQPYGEQCRALFKAREGWVLVGADASGLQMRLLAHHLAKWDGGKFAKEVVEGDVHEYFRGGTGLLLRNTQKTFNYAWLFGAQEYKLGTVVIQDLMDAREQGLYTKEIPTLQEAWTLGSKALKKLKKYVPGLTKMDKALEKARKRGFTTSYDGTRIPIRHAHAALNTVLQGGEARVMKKALHLLDSDLQDRLGLVPGEDYEFVLNVHDEWQIECRPEVAELVGEAAVEAIRAAGVAFDLRVRLDGEYKIGLNWAETH